MTQAQHPLSRFSVEDKVAIVTGAGGGIGLGIVAAFADAGARVFAVARCEESRADIENAAPGAQCLIGDLADSAVIESIVPKCAALVGPPDVLDNNATLIDGCPLTDVTAEHIDLLCAINL
jgi:NAD(P)-dependent dehydrogenase (short-subunit alcohol dehydrogenase family)